MGWGPVSIAAAADTGGQFRAGTGDWPSWVVPRRALGEWVDLQDAVGSLIRGPACRREPELWWATPRTSEGVEAQAEAAASCWWCPARLECLAYALAANEREGVWGGRTAAERRRAA